MKESLIERARNEWSCTEKSYDQGKVHSADRSDTQNSILIPKKVFGIKG